MNCDINKGILEYDFVAHGWNCKDGGSFDYIHVPAISKENIDLIIEAIKKQESNVDEKGIFGIGFWSTFLPKMEKYVSINLDNKPLTVIEDLFVYMRSVASGFEAHKQKIMSGCCK